MTLLSTMLTAQAELDARVGLRHLQPTDQKIVDGILRAAHQELSEFIDCFPFKWWRPRDAQPYDLQNAKVELIDLIHFVLSYALESYGLESLENDMVWLASLPAYQPYHTHDSILKLFAYGAFLDTQYSEEVPDQLERILEMTTLMRSMLTDETRWNEPLEVIGQLAHAIDVTPQQLVDGYFAKMAINHARQNTGYTEKTDDCRHL